MAEPVARTHSPTIHSTACVTRLASRGGKAESDERTRGEESEDEERSRGLAEPLTGVDQPWRSGGDDDSDERDDDEDEDEEDVGGGCGGGRNSGPCTMAAAKAQQPLLCFLFSFFSFF